MFPKLNYLSIGNINTQVRGQDYTVVLNNIKKMNDGMLLVPTEYRFCFGIRTNDAFRLSRCMLFQKECIFL